MKTDKELLELAAKAAGLSVLQPSKDGEDFLKSYDSVWNPLTDEGDALRLAVALKIVFVFDFNLSSGVAFIRAGVELPNLIIEQVYGDDKLAATRRAIVRAAAFIWERQQ